MISVMATLASIQALGPKLACTQGTPSPSSLRSSFRGTKLCVKVPAIASGSVPSAGQTTRMSGNGNGTGKSGAPGSAEPRLGNSGCPLYTTLGGHPVPDDNNRYCISLNCQDFIHPFLRCEEVL